MKPVRQPSQRRVDSTESQTLPSRPLRDFQEQCLMPISASDLAIGLVIAVVFLAPALAWPTLGRALLSVFFIGGATFNLLYTLPNLPASLEALVATSTIP